MKQKGFSRAETIILVVVVIIAVVLVVSYVNKKGAKSPTSDQATKDTLVKEDKDRVIDQKAEEGVALLPSGFPSEQGAQNMTSYKFIPAGTTDVQSTVTYVSQKTVAENAEIFKNYLTQAGFEIVNEENESAFHSFYAANTTENSDLSVVVSARDNLVDVNITYLKRAQ